MIRIFHLLIILLGSTSCSLNQTSNKTSVLTQDQHSAMEKKVLVLVNDYRRSQNLSPLIQSEKFTKIARAHSLEMQRKKDLSHKGFSRRASLVKKQYQRATVAENVGYNFGYAATEKRVVDSWINSSGHQVNIQGNYRYTGIGVTKSVEGNITIPRYS
jgi:uncharacterized protein YkwD